MTDSIEVYVDLYPPIPSRNEAVYEKRLGIFCREVRRAVSAVKAAGTELPKPGTRLGDVTATVLEKRGDTCARHPYIYGEALPRAVIDAHVADSYGDVGMVSASVRHGCTDEKAGGTFLGIRWRA